MRKVNNITTELLMLSALGNAGAIITADYDVRRYYERRGIPMLPMEISRSMHLCWIPDFVKIMERMRTKKSCTEKIQGFF